MLPTLANSQSVTPKVAHALAGAMIAQIGLGSVLVFSAVLAYYVFGFSWIIFFLWLSGVVLCGFSFCKKEQRFFEEIDRSDKWILLALLAVSIPVFLSTIYTVPFQVSRDETVLIAFEQNWVKDGVVDLFGLSPYFGFPYLPYLLLGWGGHFLGDINLYHERLLHGLDGVLIVVCSYIFYRVLGLNKTLSVLASLFICFNHSFVALSRMAFKDNGALVMELLALTFLFSGFKSGRFLSTYIGGVLAGIACYVYYPARITIPIWLLFLLLIKLFRSKSVASLKPGQQLAVFSLGIALTLAPLGSACFRSPDYVKIGNQFLKTSSNLFPEGRELTRIHEQSKSAGEGLMRNACDAITMFNNNVSDHGCNYINEGFGFVDPISGVFVLIGFMWVLIFFQDQLATTLIVAGFLLQLFFFCFVVSKAPDYTRLLVILPFAGYCVAFGIDATASALGSRHHDRKTASIIQRVVIAVSILSIIVFNVAIFARYAIYGAQHGQDNGGTARYLEARKWQPNHLFILAASPEFPYFTWNAPGSSVERMMPFLGPDQTFEIFSPEDVTNLAVIPPFTIFMNGELWDLKQARLKRMYPNLIVHKIADKRGLVALEEPSSIASSRSAYRAGNVQLGEIESALAQGNYGLVQSRCNAMLNTDEVLSKGSLFNASILFNLGRAYLNASQYEKALPPLRKALDVRLKLTGWHNRETLAYANALADLYMRRGEWRLAEDTYRQGLEVVQSFSQEDLYTSPPKESYAQYQKVAEALCKQGRFSEAQVILKQAPASR